MERTTASFARGMRGSRPAAAVGSQLSARWAAEGELVRIGGTAGLAQLSLVSGEAKENVARLGVGDFSVVAVRRAGTPLSMLLCAVGEHSWLLARDSPVLRVGSRKFTFAFPDQCFLALALPEGCFDWDANKLEIILVTSCTYVNHAGERDSNFCIRNKPGTNFWASAYPTIKRLSSTGLPPSQAAFPRPPTEPPATTQGTWQQAAALKLRRALRTSAATKLVAKVLTGDVDPSKHIDVVGPVATVTPASCRGAPYVFPSLRAVSDIVDAVEAASGIGTGDWSIAPDRWSQIPDGFMHWHFNLSGVMWILQGVANMGGRNKADGNECMPFGEGLVAELVSGEVRGRRPRVCAHGGGGGPDGGDENMEENVDYMRGSPEPNTGKRIRSWV